MTITVAPRRRAYEALLATTTRARIAWQRFADRRILGQLADSNPLGTRLVACFDRLDPQTSAEHARIHAIEQERRRMLNDDSPLIDGSEAEPGLYDKGQTIGAVTKVSKSPRGALLLYQLFASSGRSSLWNWGRTSASRLRIKRRAARKRKWWSPGYIGSLAVSIASGQIASCEARAREHQLRAGIVLRYAPVCARGARPPGGPGVHRWAPSVSANARLLRGAVAALPSDCHLRVR